MLRSSLFVFAALVVLGLCAPKTINYVPMFDFDINLLHTDAKLMAVHRVNNQWVPVNVTDEEWAWMKDRPDYKKNPNMDFYRQDSDEEGYDTFKMQTLRAIQNPDNFGSAYPLWKSHVIHGVPFFIITARSHFPASIRDGMEVLIRRTFTQNEMEEMFKNIVEMGIIYGLSPVKGWWGEAYRDSDNILTNYLHGCEFIAVSSPYWAFRHNCTLTELCKALTVRNLVPYAQAFQRYAEEHSQEQLTVMSFFDDTKENVVAVMNEMKLLAVEHPEICFRVFDTHDTKQYVQYDINKACDGIEPGQDWQAKDFHAAHAKTLYVKLH